VRKICLILLVGLLVGSIGVTALAKKEKLLVYTSCPIDIMTQLEQAFEAANPDIDLEIYRSGTGTVTAKITTELEAGKVLADLIFVADYATYERYKALDLLLAYDSPEAVNLPEMLVDPDKCYYGARVFAMIIAYNTAQVTAPPTRWSDLLDTEWWGQIVVADPQYSGSNVVTNVGLALEYGLSYFRELRANEVVVIKGNTKTATEVAAGAFRVSLTLDNMVRGMKAQGSPIDLVYPEDGAILLPSPIAIVKTSEHVAAAKTFVDYLLSAEGQQVLVDIGNYIPARSDVAPPAGAPTLDELIAGSMDIGLDYLLNTKDFYLDQFVTIVIEE